MSENMGRLRVTRDISTLSVQIEPNKSFGGCSIGLKHHSCATAGTRGGRGGGAFGGKATHAGINGLDMSCQAANIVGNSPTTTGHFPGPLWPGGPHVDVYRLPY